MNTESIIEGQLIPLSEANNLMAAEIAKSRMKPERLEEKYLEAEKKVEYHFTKGLDWYIKAGTYLCILKAKLGHGNWEPFLERVGLNQPNAFRRMELARYYTALPTLNPDTNELWTYSDALAVIKALKSREATNAVLDDLKSLETPEDLEPESIADLVPKKKRAQMSGRNRVKQKVSRALVDLRQEFDTDPAIADDITHFIAELEAMLVIETDE